MSSASKKGPNWRDVLGALRQRRVLLTLMLGLSAGLPFMLTGNTLALWLRESGTTLTAIGFLSWVGLAYSMKFLWAPILDKVNVPIFGRLGHRRGWLLLSQLTISAGLLAMAFIGPGGGLMAFAGLAVVVAFASATQDIAVDAWRIEAAGSDEQLALLTSAFLLGYRAALLITDALILIAAAKVGWSMSYVMMAALMSVGIIAVMFAPEPLGRRSQEDLDADPLWTVRGLFDAIAGPFIAFFKAHGRSAIIMLAAISLYRLGDFVMGPMAGPLYIDLGIEKETIGTVRASVGLFATLIGVSAAGLSAVRFGFVPTLIAGAILGPGSNLAFSAMALMGDNLLVFNIAMAVDNFSGGFAGTALVAWMSSLTNIGYTAGQYALLSSFYAILGKTLKGFSGAAVDWLTGLTDLMTAYAIFFAGTALIAIPTLMLCLMVAKVPKSAPGGAA